MKFHKQRFLHNPPLTYGDCQRTCFACLLDMEPEDIPNFGENYYNVEAWEKQISEWLKTMNLTKIRIFFHGPLQNVLTSMKSCNPGHYYLLGGVSARGTNHVVIGLDDAIIHDTAIFGDDLSQSIVGPYPDTDLYDIEFLVHRGHRA